MATIERTNQPGEQTGFHCSPLLEFIVAASGSITPAQNFDRPYAAIAVSCNDASGIPSRALMFRTARYEDAGTLNPLWKLNGPARFISGTLPTSGGFDFVVTDAFYVTQIQPEFTGTLTAACTLYISGYEPGIK